MPIVLTSRRCEAPIRRAKTYNLAHSRCTPMALCSHPLRSVNENSERIALRLTRTSYTSHITVSLLQTQQLSRATDRDHAGALSTDLLDDSIGPSARYETIAIVGFVPRTTEYVRSVDGVPGYHQRSATQGASSHIVPCQLHAVPYEPSIVRTHAYAVTRSEIRRCYIEHPP